MEMGAGPPVLLVHGLNGFKEGWGRMPAALARAGSEIVRLTVDRDEAAAAVPHIRDRLMLMGVDVPLVGDFHYIGHKLLADHPACAEALAKYRINPGNVGFKAKRDSQFGAIIEMAMRHDKPVRIGVNWGSLDQELLTHLMDENAASAAPVSSPAASAVVSASAVPESSVGLASSAGPPSSVVPVSTRLPASVPPASTSSGGPSLPLHAIAIARPHTQAIRFVIAKSPTKESKSTPFGGRARNKEGCDSHRTDTQCGPF